MRLISALLLSIFMVFTAPACSEEEAPADENAATEEGAEENAEGEEKTKEGTDEKSDEAEKKADDGEAKAEGDDKNAEAKPADEPAAEEAKPKVSDEECKAACGHITTLTMDSLPAETKDEAKVKIAEALKERCPIDCLKHGTPEAMKCVMAAKTAVDLAACPK
jgi:hypothetical protein